jgi:ADP-ribose pyrophosphatase YjhB (NUDIX family)
MTQVGVHAIVLNSEGHVLLVKRNYLEHDWIPPGGRLEENESVPDAVIREVLEETGYLVAVKELIAVGSRPATNDLIIVVAADMIEKRSSVEIDPAEISEIQFFPFDQLPSPMKPEARKLLALFQSGARGQMLVIG